jgi:hypothetical protein
MNKTLKREVVVERANTAMKAEWLSNKEKLAIATFAENILIAANSYNGYTVDVDENVASNNLLTLKMFEELPVEERKELEVSTRRYF